MPPLGGRTSLPRPLWVQSQNGRFMHRVRLRQSRQFWRRLSRPNLTVRPTARSWAIPIHGDTLTERPETGKMLAAASTLYPLLYPERKNTATNQGNTE